MIIKEKIITTLLTILILFIILGGMLFLILNPFLLACFALTIGSYGILVIIFGIAANIYEAIYKSLFDKH